MHALYMYKALRTAVDAPVTAHSADRGDHSALTYKKTDMKDPDVK